MTDDRSAERPAPRLALVGPCAAGKSTLAEVLRAAGYVVRHVAQEHSHVPDMWRRLARPDLLIFLDVSYEAALARRPRGMGGPDWMVEQADRLAHARAHCDFYLDTSPLSIPEVAGRVFAFLDEAAAGHTAGRRAAS